MYHYNDNYLHFPGSYLFATVGKKVAEYQAAHPDAKIIKLGLGDVTQPLAPVVIDAMHKAVDEMGNVETFHGYCQGAGYEWLRKAIQENDYKARGCEVDLDEIFISDGGKGDGGNVQELFAATDKVAVCDPVYPVYVDSNVMGGRGGVYDEEKGLWSNLIYMPCTEANGFVPEFPKETPDIINLCFPNNPTGGTITKAALQDWVDYANKNGALIIYDAAYEAYIREDGIPHSIFECEGARDCAIELRSFSKTAGFTGIRLGYLVIPKNLQKDGFRLRDLWARHQTTKFNGVSYVSQRGGEAIFTPEGKEQIKATIDYYLDNARTIKQGLQAAGYTVYGGDNAPYIWLKTPDGMGSWEFFDYLLDKGNIVGTPGCGFGPSGEGFLRLTAFGSKANSELALERFKLL